MSWKQRLEGRNEFPAVVNAFKAIGINPRLIIDRTIKPFPLDENGEAHLPRFATASFGDETIIIEEHLKTKKLGCNGMSVVKTVAYISGNRPELETEIIAE
mgnify:FL=1